MSVNERTVMIQGNWVGDCGFLVPRRRLWWALAAPDRQRHLWQSDRSFRLLYNPEKCALLDRTCSTPCQQSSGVHRWELYSREKYDPAFIRLEAL